MRIEGQVERGILGFLPAAFVYSHASHEAMRVIGHKTPSMLMRYYNPKAEDLALKLA